MKQTIFNVKNLFTDKQLEVQTKLIDLSLSLTTLDTTSKDYKHSPISIVDESLSYVDKMDNMLIFRAIVEKGYLLDNHIALTKLTIILNALRYQNINLVKFGLIRDNKSNMGKYDLLLILPDDRDMIYASNVKNLEYILSDSNKTDDKIMKESEFNVLDYPRICLFDYDLITHTLTHIDTRVEEDEPSFPDYPEIQPPMPDGPGVRTYYTKGLGLNEIHIDATIPDFIKDSSHQSTTFTKKTVIDDIKDRVSIMFNKPNVPELQTIHESKGTIN